MAQELEELKIAWLGLRARVEQLAAERQQYLEFFENAAEAYVVTALDGRIVEANGAAVDVLHGGAVTDNVAQFGGKRSRELVVTSFNLFEGRGIETKHIFKRAVRDLVPAEILNRPKQGFGIPIDRWINEQLRDRVRGTLTEPRTMQRGYVEPRYVILMLDENQRGRRDHAGELWALFMLELWHRKFVDAPGGIPLGDHLNQSLAPMVA